MKECDISPPITQCISHILPYPSYIPTINGNQATHSHRSILHAIPPRSSQILCHTHLPASYFMRLSLIPPQPAVHTDPFICLQVTGQQQTIFVFCIKIYNCDLEIFSAPLLCALKTWSWWLLEHRCFHSRNPPHSGHHRRLLFSQTMLCCS